MAPEPHQCVMFKTSSNRAPANPLVSFVVPTCVWSFEPDLSSSQLQFPAVSSTHDRVSRVTHESTRNGHGGEEAKGTTGSLRVELFPKGPKGNSSSSPPTVRLQQSVSPAACYPKYHGSVPTASHGQNRWLPASNLRQRLLPTDLHQHPLKPTSQETNPGLTPTITLPPLRLSSHPSL